MIEFKRQLKCWLRLAICDELVDVRNEFLHGHEHGVVSDVRRECLLGRGRDVVPLDTSGNAQWQYGHGDHRAGVSLPNDGHHVKENGALVQHAQENDELLRGVRERGAQVRDEQVRVLALVLIQARQAQGLQLWFFQLFQAKPALILYFLVDTKYQDVHYMGCHSANRNNDLRVVLCGKDLHGIQADYCPQDQGLARRLYDEQGFRDELEPHGVRCDDQELRGELVPNGVQVIHDGQVHYDGLVPQHDAQLDDGQVHHGEPMAHGVLEFHDEQVLECDVIQHGGLVENVARALVYDVPQHHGAHVRQHDDQQEHDAQKQKCALDHGQFAQKLKGGQVGQSDDLNGSHHVVHVLPGNHGGYNRVLGDEYRMDDSG